MTPVYKLFTLLLVVGLLAVPACMAQEEPAAETSGGAEGMTEEQHNTFYALGMALSQGLTQFELSEAELEAVQEGLADGVLGTETDIDLQEYAPRLQALAQERTQAAGQRERAAGAELLDEAAAEEGATKTESGMVYKSIDEGSGASPEASDTVQVHYRGTLRDGTVFDSSYERGQPATFPLNQVIPCWTEGLQRMKVGGKAELVCPPDLAYGDRPNASIPPGSTLKFEVELLDVVEEEGGEEGTQDEGATESDEPMEEEGGR